MCGTLREGQVLRAAHLLPGYPQPKAVTVDPVGTTRTLLPMPMSDGSPEYFPPPPGVPGSVIVDSTAPLAGLSATSVEALVPTHTADDVTTGPATTSAGRLALHTGALPLTTLSADTVVPLAKKPVLPLKAGTPEKDPSTAPVD